MHPKTEDRTTRTMETAMGKTLYDKLWERHLIDRLTEDLDWLYVDRHYIYEYNANLIESLRLSGQPVGRPRRTIGVMDHAISSAPGRVATAPWTQVVIDRLRSESAIAGMPLLDDDTPDQGIAHGEMGRQSRSTIVTLAMPPPSHIVCRP